MPRKFRLLRRPMRPGILNFTLYQMSPTHPAGHIGNFESPKRQNQPHVKGHISNAQRTGHLTQVCRTSVLCWLLEVAANDTFQPTDSEQLLKAVCAFLKSEVLTEVQELRTRYARPSTFSRTIIHRDNLWSAFRHLRSVPASEPLTLEIEQLSTKPLQRCTRIAFN